MRSALRTSLLIFGCGCASDPLPETDLAAACRDERTAAIRRDWAKYEQTTGERVVFPDWRSLARQWARVECSRGTLVAAFHPSDTATARRHY